VKRRAFLLMPLALAAARARGDDGYPEVTAGRVLQFPRDHGAHAAYRTEWWYVTGWLRNADGRDLGFQVTFFRTRPRVAEDNPSGFAPRQLVFAHAAIADPAHGRLVHEERAARTGFGLAEAREERMDVHLDDWSLVLAEGDYRAVIPAREFALDLSFSPSRRFSCKGTEGTAARAPSRARRATTTAVRSSP